MAADDRWIGAVLGGGRYRIRSPIGAGSMGQVYLARDNNLATDVVVKFPLPPGDSPERAGFLERFDREARSLVSLSHPHVVKVIDVGRQDGRPYLVMQYLAGGSLTDRMTDNGLSRPHGLPAATLAGWLMDVAKALDFLHRQNFLHRDVKPANILFDLHGHAFLGDLGVIKAMAPTAADRRASGLTAPGFLLGTPNYVAPEVVMGLPGDGRVDQYALGMTVHEVLTGVNVMAGPTPSATVVNQTTVDAPPLLGLVPGVPRRLSDAVRRALAKDPRQRFDTCSAFAWEALADLPGPSGSSVVLPPSSSSAEVPVIPAPPPDSGYVPALLYGPDDFASGEHALGRYSAPPAATAPARRQGPSRTAGLVLLGLGAMGFFLALAGWLGSGDGARTGRVPPSPVLAGSPRPPAFGSAAPAGGPVEVNVAYGTEKQKWLEQALGEYEKVHDPRLAKIHLIGLGSLEGAEAVIRGPSSVPIHVWSPASSAYRDVFESRWREAHGESSRPIGRTEYLARTPMVFVTWKTRREAFRKTYPKVTFRTLSAAMLEPGGWSTIAGEPGWGPFKFGHTHPNLSNSGLLTLVLTAYEFAGKRRDLTHDDVMKPEFQDWLSRFEAKVTRHGSGLTHSTGTMMREMVLRGPSQYDCVVSYENLVIDYLEAAREQWGDLRIDYPEPNLWNDHPYYVLDVPWSSREVRAEAARFLDFLMSEPIQRRALREHGFRPGNPFVSVRGEGSPFVKNAAVGLRIDVPEVAQPPRARVVEDLLSTFEKIDR